MTPQPSKQPDGPITGRVALGLALKSAGVVLTDEHIDRALASLTANRWNLRSEAAAPDPVASPLTVLQLGAALDRAWLASGDAQFSQRPPDLAAHLWEAMRAGSGPDPVATPAPLDVERERQLEACFWRRCQHVGLHACIEAQLAVERGAPMTPQPSEQPTRWHRYDGDHDCWAAGCDLAQPAPPAEALRLLRAAIGIIEAADHRASAADGPVGHVRDEMTDSEWRVMYETLTEARRFLEGAVASPALPLMSIAEIRQAAVKSCEEHADQEHVNQIPPCAGAMIDAHWWAAAFDLARMASAVASPAPLDVERLARVLRYHPMHWEVRRPDGAFVMTRMFSDADEAAQAIARDYEAEGQPVAEEPEG